MSARTLTPMTWVRKHVNKIYRHKCKTEVDILPPNQMKITSEVLKIQRRLEREYPKVEPESKQGMNMIVFVTDAPRRKVYPLSHYKYSSETSLVKSSIGTELGTGEYDTTSW